MLEKVILIVHVLTAISIVGLILLQQGKGADMGASFGSGASQTVLGAQGGGNLLTRGTAILATLFFVTSLGLAMYAKQRVEGAGQIEIPIVVEDKTVPDDLPMVDGTSSGAARDELPAVETVQSAGEADDMPEVVEPVAREEGESGATK